jgi:hypothetical protein
MIEEEVAPEVKQGPPMIKQKTEIRKNNKVEDKKTMMILTGVTILCVVDIIVMGANPFSMFTVLPFFMLPMFFLSFISICLLVAQLGK